MSVRNGSPISVAIPPDLASRIEEQKLSRRQDRDKSIEDLVLELCENYVRARERTADEARLASKLEESYRLDPFDFTDKWPAEGDRRSTDEAR